MSNKASSTPSLTRRDFLKVLGTLSLLPLGVSASSAATSSHPASASQSPNILILVNDALSASHMSLYGYPRQTTPNLERFAGQATVYHKHHSGGSFTTPGTASILTGTYPWSHRALHLHGTMLEKYAQRNFFHLAAPGYHRLGYSHNLLVTSLMYQMRDSMEQLMPTRDLVLADVEYSDKTFPNDFNVSFWSEALILRGLSTKASSLFLSRLFRLSEALQERGLLQKYGELFPQGIPNINGLYYTMEKGIDWLMAQLGQLPQPFLAYIHFYPPHHPYYTRRDFVDRFKDDYVPLKKPRHRFAEAGVNQKYLNQQRKAYDEYLAYTDSEFGRLYDHLQNSGLLSNTCLFFTSDHGEMFERGIWGHGTRTLFEPLVRVPLIVARPGQADHQDIQTPTSNVDLLPTLMHLMGQPTPEWCEGQILPTFGEQPPSGSQRSIYVMEAKQNSQRGQLNTGSFAALQWPYKLIHYRGYESKSGAASEDKDELYNLENDPEEMNNLIQTEKSIASALRQELDLKLQEKNTISQEVEHADHKS